MTNLSDESLKKGIFFGFVPQNLVIQDRPELSVFPLNVMFAQSKVAENGEMVHATALYQPMLSTYKLDSKQCSMEYFNIYGHGSWLLITYNLESHSYRGEKYVGETKAGEASGPEWKMFFVHFTMLGLSDGERCKFDEIPTPPKKPVISN